MDHLKAILWKRFLNIHVASMSLDSKSDSNEFTKETVEVETRAIESFPLCHSINQCLISAFLVFLSF